MKTTGRLTLSDGIFPTDLCWSDSGVLLAYRQTASWKRIENSEMDPPVYTSWSWQTLRMLNVENECWEVVFCGAGPFSSFPPSPPCLQAECSGGLGWRKWKRQTCFHYAFHLYRWLGQIWGCGSPVWGGQRQSPGCVTVLLFLEFIRFWKFFIYFLLKYNWLTVHSFRCTAKWFIYTCVYTWASLTAQWWRTCLPMQET